MKINPGKVMQTKVSEDEHRQCPEYVHWPGTHRPRTWTAWPVDNRTLLTVEVKLPAEGQAQNDKNCKTAMINHLAHVRNSND